MIYTPYIEQQLINYYWETSSNYFNRLKPFINYIDEVKELFIEEALQYCKSKEDRYNKSSVINDDGSINTPLTFFKTILKNKSIDRSMSLLCYLDNTRPNHDFQVAVNGSIWNGILTKARREYNLKQLVH